MDQVSPTRRARVALIITELDVGGAERALVNLATGLDRDAFDPLVVALGPRPADGNPLIIQLAAADVPTYFLQARSSWHAWSTFRRLQRLLRREQPELVQTFLFHANVLGTLAARRAGVRHVVTGIRVADPSRWRWRLERWSSRFADRIVCVSDAVAACCRVPGRFPGNKLVVIPNGVDLGAALAEPAIDLRTLGVAEQRRALLCVGRLHPQKGIDWLLEMAPTLLAQLPEHELLIVGDGPERDRLHNVARSLPVAERIHFLGWRGDVHDLLRASSLLLLPSRWEGMPNVLLEAMATGLPAVATRVEGVLQVLGDEPGPQVVDFGDSHAFIRSVREIAEQPRLARRLGEQNRKRVVEHFTMARMVERYAELYDSLLLPSCTR